MSVWISGTCVRDPRTDESILSERMPRMPRLFDVGFGQYGENSATKYVSSIFSLRHHASGCREDIKRLQARR